MYESVVDEASFGVMASWGASGLRDPDTHTEVMTTPDLLSQLHPARAWHRKLQPTQAAHRPPPRG
jgi:hypothetical protein